MPRKIQLRYFFKCHSYSCSDQLTCKSCFTTVIVKYNNGFFFDAVEYPEKALFKVFISFKIYDRLILYRLC